MKSTPTHLKSILSAAFGLTMTASHAATLTAGYTKGTSSQLITTNGGAGAITFVDNAVTGGADITFNGSPTTAGFVWRIDAGSNWSVGNTVSLTGLAVPLFNNTTDPEITTNNTSGGTFTFSFYSGGANNDCGRAQATLVGTAKGTLTVTGVTTIMYWNFPAPVNFTSAGTGLIVKIQSTAALRIKAQNQGLDIFATGIWYTNDGRNTFGTLRSSRISLGGTAIAPAVPEILSITRSGTSTNLTWDLNGASTVTLQRSTTLEPGSFTDIPSRTNTTETSYEETSTDPKAFFRLATP